MPIFRDGFRLLLHLLRQNRIYVKIIWTLKLLSVGISAWPSYIWGQEKLMLTTSICACFLWLFCINSLKFIKILKNFWFFFIYSLFMTIRNILVENSMMETGPGRNFNIFIFKLDYFNNIRKFLIKPCLNAIINEYYC